MNRRLSTCLLFGALLSLSLTARGQDTGSTIAQKNDSQGTIIQDGGAD
jgi:hypothetical protein